MPGALVNSITTPALLLADAKELSKVLLTTARQRTTISRAYYSAYHACQEIYGRNISQDRTTGIHRQFIRELTGSPDRKVKAVGTRLNGLYTKRLLADYQMAAPITAQLALDAIEDAEEIVVDLLGFEPGPS